MGQQRSTLRLLDWRWLVVIYCLLVLFHLLPTFVYLGVHLGMKNFFLKSAEQAWPAGVWLAAGIIIITAYLGRRSDADIMVASGIGAALYALTSIIATSTMGALPATSHRILVVTGRFVIIMLAAFAIGCVGFAVGSWMRRRSGQQQKELAE